MKEYKYWTVSLCGKYLVKPNGEKVTHRTQTRKTWVRDLETGKINRNGPPEWSVTIPWGTHNTMVYTFDDKAAYTKWLKDYLSKR